MGRNWKRQGDEALLAGDLAAADHAYSVAIEESEERAEMGRYALYSNRSAARHNARDFVGALNDGQRAVFLKPSHAPAHLRIGFALQGLDRLEEARDAFAAGIVHVPDDVTLVAAIAHVSELIKRKASGKARRLEHQSNDERRYDEFMQWMREGGAEFSAVVLRVYEDEHRGVHADQDIAPNQVLISVPRRLIITSEIAFQSAIGKAIIRSGVEIRSRHSFLASFLLQERARTDSEWAPYINVLPQAFRNIPLNFTREELVYLKGSMAIDKIESRVETLRSEYERIAKNVPQFAIFSYEDFVWARCVVITRIFGVTIDGRKTEAMVPLADFLNHRRPRETVWLYEPVTSAFTITALHNIAGGSQISDSYGRKCNSRFFTNYGFSLEDNDDNEAVLCLRLRPDDPALARKVALFGADDSETGRLFSVVAVISSGSMVDELLSYLRLISATDSEFDTIFDQSVPNLKRISTISRVNEMQALLVLKSACIDALSAFDTTLDEDDELLVDSSLTTNIRNAIIMRRGEKRVLKFFIEFVDDMVPLLSMPKSDLDWIYSHCQRRDCSGAFDHYICHILKPLMQATPDEFIAGGAQIDDPRKS